MMSYFLSSDRNTFSLKCNPSETIDLFEEALKDVRPIFTFYELCIQMQIIAQNRELFKDLDVNPNLVDIRIDRPTIEQLHLFIWNKIWDKKIILDLVYDIFANQDVDGIRLRKLDI